MQNNPEMKEKLNNSKIMVDKELKTTLKNIELSLQPKSCCPPSLSNVLIILFLFICLIYMIIKL